MKSEKSTLSVLFYLKKDKAKKNGLVPIHARITIDGKITQFNTKLEISESCWKSGKVMGKSFEATRINSTLNEIRAGIHTHYHTLQQRDGYVTAERVKNAFLGKWKIQCVLIPKSKTGLTPENYLILTPKYPDKWGSFLF